MTDAKLTALSALTAPTDDDILYIVDAPGTTPASKKITWANIKAALNAYVLYANALKFSPADGTTYYIGSLFANIPLSTAGAALIVIPKAGKITRVDLNFRNLTTNGTTEQSTVSLRLNNTTDTTLTSTLDLSASRSIAVTGLSIAVIAGDYFEIKWVTPTWATNPVDLCINAQIFVDQP